MCMNGDVMLTMDYEIVLNDKGSRMLIYDHFLYIEDRTTTDLDGNETKYFNCRLHDNKFARCRATAIIKDGQILRGAKRHNHIEDIIEIEALRIANGLKPPVIKPL